MEPLTQCRALLEGLGQCPNRASTRVRTPAGFSEFGVCDEHVDEAERHGLCLDVHEPDDSRLDVDPEPIDVHLAVMAERGAELARAVLNHLRVIELETEVLLDAKATTAERDHAPQIISRRNHEAIKGTLEIVAKLAMLGSTLRVRR